jgi:hypothetical protein
MKRILSWLPQREIIDACNPSIGPLMVRYFLLRSRWLGLYIHHFRRSDNDRHFHDHPWGFLTFLLSSGYFEHTPAGVFWRRRFSVLYRPAEWLHWVEVPRPVWTLVVRLPRRRVWGFITPAGWVDHKTYGSEWCE